MDKRIEKLVKNWARRNIEGFYFSDRGKAKEKILEMLIGKSSIGISGSQTLEELGIVKELEARRGKVFNQYKPGLSRQESLKIREEGSRADYYLASPNAISENGELVFLSAFGNRITGVSYARNVIIVSGINKLTTDVSSAIRRARNYATPLNCKRLQYKSACLKTGSCQEDICLFPEYKRMCCQLLIIEAEIQPDRLKVVLIGENLGY